MFFHFTEKRFGLASGTIKATVLIETLPAVFQMEEILFHMKKSILWALIVDVGIISLAISKR